MTVSTAHLVVRRIERKERERALKIVKDCHGDLPPIEKFYGEGTFFLSIIAPYYLAADRNRAALKKAMAEAGFPPPKWNAVSLQFALPIDPDPADDCPECDNGMDHEKCRDGWRDQLRANVRDYAIAKFGSMPAWKCPCDTCGGNCGQCGTSHCARCGAKGDQKCDLVQHEAWKLEHPTEHAALEQRKARERATGRVKHFADQLMKLKNGDP